MKSTVIIDSETDSNKAFDLLINSYPNSMRDESDEDYTFYKNFDD